ncbi:MAG: YciI family protein [Pirellulales bacterium]
MKYMLLVYSDEKAWNPEEWVQCTKDSTEICCELQAKGQYLFASPLHPVATAHCVRQQEGKAIVTRGPFAETTEQLGGFFAIDVPNLDDAIAIAERLPAAKKGTIEIRPVRDLESLPPASHETNAGGPKFMFLCYDDEEAWKNLGEAEHRKAMEVASNNAKELFQKGWYVSAAPLHGSDTATCVRLRQNRKAVTDGPYTETREILGGYFIVATPTLEDALHYASRHPGLRFGAVEVRQIFDLPALPQSGFRSDPLHAD